METGVYIGNVFLAGHFGLAPMAGFSDMAFRSICRDLGAGYSCTEMISAKALVYQDKKTKELTQLASNETPAAVQIFGSEPEIMAKGAELALLYSGAQLLDINMGCPARKIVSAGDGSALLKHLNLAESIIRQIKKNIHVPLTVKFRLGWDDQHIVATEFAKMAEAAGVDGLCIHGRTTAQHYSGVVNKNLMAEVVSAVRIPVLVNGDIQSHADGLALLSYTGASFALIGRGALGNPWIFSENASPTLSDKMNIFLRQAGLAVIQKGEERAIRELRSHLCHYLSAFPGAAGFREQAIKMTTMEDAMLLAEKVSSININSNSEQRQL